jgi:hypothetical protein
MEISRAINQVVDDLFPKNNPNEVLQVNINLCAYKFTEDGKNEKHAIKSFYLFFYRSSTYTFIGCFDPKNEIIYNFDKANIEYISYHDSCWRDGTDRAIKDFVDELINQFDKNDNVFVFNTFGMDGFKKLKATINMNSDKRTAILNLIK